MLTTPCLQPGRSCNNFKCGSWFIRIYFRQPFLHILFKAFCSESESPAFVFSCSTPVSSYGLFRSDSRNIRHRVELAVFRIQDDDRNTLRLLLIHHFVSCLLCKFLDIGIKADFQIQPFFRFQPGSPRCSPALRRVHRSG